MKNISWINIWINLRLLLIFAGVVFLMAFTSNRNNNRKLIKAIVDFEGIDNQFVSQTIVNKLLICNADSVNNLKKLNLNLNQIEKSINAHKMIEHSEVFVSIDGVLKTIVKQRTPIARFFNDVGSFYIDCQGSKMPLSPQLSARVPLVFGSLNEKNKASVFAFLKYVADDDFLKKSVVSVSISNNDDVMLKIRNYDFDLDFGKCENIEAKFNNYKAFFQKTSQDSTIYNYRKISLKYDHQVVDTK